MNAGLVKRGYWNGTAVAKLTNTELTEYIDACAAELMAINAKAAAAGRAAPFPHPRIDAAKYELVPQSNGMLSVVKRAKPLIDEFTSSDVGAGTMTPQAMGFDKAFHRGKYNDAADRLIDNDTASVELRELQGVGING